MPKLPLSSRPACRRGKGGGPTGGHSLSRGRCLSLLCVVSAAACGHGVESRGAASRTTSSRCPPCRHDGGVQEVGGQAERVVGASARRRCSSSSSSSSSSSRRVATVTDFGFPCSRLWPVSRLAGLLPMTATPCRCRPGASWPEACPCAPLLASGAWLLYSLALAAVLVCWPPINIHYFQSPDVEAREMVLGKHNDSTEAGLTNHLVSNFDVVSIAFIAAASIVQGAVSQDLFLRLIAQLKKVDALLRYAPRGASNWLLLFLSAMLFVVLLDVVYKCCHSPLFAVRTLPTYASYLITYIREVMFVDDVNRLNARFANINSELEACLSPAAPACAGKNSLITVPPAFLEKINPEDRWRSNPRTTVHPQRTYHVGRAAAADSVGERKRARIARLAAGFDMLCMGVDVVARQYSLFLLCDMLGLLVRLVITTYFIIGMVAEARDFNPHITEFIIIQALWLVSHASRMFVLVAPCSTTMEQTTRTGNIVSTSLGRDGHDSQLYQQLKSLSLHLLHRKIGFSAFGVFKLSLPLVCTVLSAVTTYLVVLIQLRMSPDQA